jgi:8-oxo-dGTP pyrophosphatase MutT (NUDIX family)
MTTSPGLAGRLHDGVPVPPRPASSVLVVDGRQVPWRLLMLRRPGGADFAPSAYVFPGGAVHEVDERFADPSRATAARELFEEVGILLARRADGRSAGDRDCARLREALAAGRDWPAALEITGLKLAFDRLVPLTRWITPERVTRRFDTRFFVTRRPPGQQVHPQPAEVEDWLWLTPHQALTGQLTLVHATRRILESVSSEPDVRRLISRLRRRRREPRTIQPQIVELPDGGFQVVEGEPVTRGPAISASGRASDRRGRTRPRPGEARPLPPDLGTGPGNRPGGHSS